MTDKQELPPSATSSMQSMKQGEQEESEDTTQPESPKRKYATSFHRQNHDIVKWYHIIVNL